MSSNQDIIDRLLVVASALHDAKFDEFGDDIADMANVLQAREPNYDHIQPAAAKPVEKFMPAEIMAKMALPPGRKVGMDLVKELMRAVGPGMMPDDQLDAYRYAMMDMHKVQKDRVAMAPKKPEQMPVFFYERTKLADGTCKLALLERVNDQINTIKSVLSNGQPHTPRPCDVKLHHDYDDNSSRVAITTDGSLAHVINGLDPSLAKAIYENQKRLVMANQIPNHPPKYGQKWEV